MCGIAGTYNRNNKLASREFLLAMAGELLHRGPDGVGLYLDRQFGMVNTRLSIVDLAGGDQPLSNEDGRYWVMQNGEIYNYPELQAELESYGHRFTTRCDTEVLVHAYEQWGPDCLHKLNGAFAFAIWDRDKEELFLARDRFGIRPLFLSQFGGSLSFASEAKALLRHPEAERAIDPLSLVETFTLWAVLPDRSAFKGIRELPAGHYLRWGPRGPIEERRWWDLRFAHPAELRTENEAELTEELKTLLEDATRLRLRADVPVGVYLSGGLDSSAMAALTRIFNRQTLQGFAVSFTDPLFDESPFQDRMARSLDVELSRVRVAGSDIAELFPKVVALAEKPILRTAPAPLLRLSALVRQSGFKVVLTGEGADEVFAGYNIFKETMVRRFWARQPESKYRPLLLKRLYPYLAQDLGRAGQFLNNFFGAGLTETDDLLYSHNIRFHNTARCIRFLSRDIIDRAMMQGDPKTRLRARLPADFAEFSALGKAQYLEINTFLAGYLLHSQGDRMLMGHSVEGRFPFLDHRIAEFAAQLPDWFRLRGLKEKYLLRKAVAPLLPKEISRREKRPYRAPILPSFVGPGAPDYVGELLQADKLEQVGLFNPLAVERLLQRSKRNLENGIGETDEMALVGIISSQLLYEQMVARPTLAPLAEPNRVVIGNSIERSKVVRSAT